MFANLLYYWLLAFLLENIRKLIRLTRDLLLVLFSEIELEICLLLLCHDWRRIKSEHTE